MTTQVTVGSALATALIAARKACTPTVHKAGKNEAQRYTYVGHEHVLTGGARNALLENGLVLMLESYEMVGADSYKKGEGLCWRWRGRFVLLHAPSGETRELTYEATTVPNDKAGFVASTALDRTAHMRVLELAGSDEENPEHDSNEPKPERARKSKGDARERPLAQQSAPASSPTSANGSPDHQTSAPRSSGTTAPSPSSSGRPLPTTAEGWRASHDAVCEQLFGDADIAPGAADQYGLHVPTLPVPSFSNSAKQHASARYDAVPPGYLRAALWIRPAFWRDASAPQRAWVSYLVAKHEIEKLEQAAADKALGAGAA